MTTCGWTGGKWAASVGACYDQVEVVDGPLICFAAIRDESKANARLIASAPSLYEALTDLLSKVEREECHHEATHRGGAIWTFCNDCGKKWADDEGGFVPYVEPTHIVKARAALAAARGKG